MMEKLPRSDQREQGLQGNKEGIDSTTRVRVKEAQHSKEEI